MTGARYLSTDGKLPRYLALYDIQHTDLFSQDKYTRLRANRSPLEADLVQRLGLLDRRTCEKLDETSPASKNAASAPKFIATISSDDKYTGDGRELESTTGWRRTHRHKVFDSLLIGVGKEPEANVAPNFLTIYGELCILLCRGPTLAKSGQCFTEFCDEKYLDSSSWQGLTGEKRSYRLLKATDNTATI